ncbi:MAG: sensor histidine kinase [Flammeovirgaceae bacterium]
MAIIHVIIVALTFQLLSFNKSLFIASEVLVIISLIVSVSLFRDFYAPIKMLLSGTDAIKDKDFNIKYLKTGKLELDQLIEAFNGMVDRLREERTYQQEQHYFLEKLIQASPVGIMVLDLEENIASVNPKICRLLGIAENQLLGQAFNSVSHPLLKGIVESPLGESATLTLEGFKTYKCQKSHFLSRGFEQTFILIEELTAERLKIEKEAYGKVIRMMAHEVNNTIGPINSILGSVKKFLGEKNEQNAAYQNALSVAYDRNQRLNQFMRNFADVVRLPQPHRTPENMVHLIRDIHTLMQSQAQAKEIDFQLTTPTTPVYIQVDKQQLEQALVNIIKNAFEAVEQQGIVELILSPNTLMVRDNGKGIPPELADQIFSPFFSNKTQGQGIGLTLTKEILLNHDFDFSLATQVDGWTVFNIHFVRSHQNS